MAAPIKRVLIVSPHFPPINAPDHQRIRTALPFLEEYGWKAAVLAVHAKYVEGVEDSLLEKTFPATTRIVRTRALSVRLTRLFGVGSVARATEFGVEDSIDDVDGAPRAVRARVRVRVAVVARAAEVRPSGDAQVVRQTRIHVAVALLESDRIGVGEGRHVRRGAAAVGVDVADIVVLHDDR